ncbi:hypothetical protein AZE42_13500 [Rhizopogon vesiculosus]|uniref:Uncharacterized protein n=1 Tax=Rhizopogon vesiculosus TaxID=180088 RepID=A0A1J8QA05_9AGAM|nr:hypothetical protein AZE42_13500 [Rhizopogon vesiculosus]
MTQAPANPLLQRSPFVGTPSSTASVFPPSVCAAVTLDTPSLDAPPLRRRRVQLHTRKSLTNNLSVIPLPVPNTALTSTSTAMASVSAPSAFTEVEKFMPVPSVALQNMVPAAANVWVSDPDCIPYSFWDKNPICTTIAPHHVFLDNLRIAPTPYDSDPEFTKVLTPYSADHLDIFLRNAHLLDSYPQLSEKIRYGFPLGNLDPIDLTYAPPNLPSALEHDTLIQDYITSELSLGRFSGPFTQLELEAKIGPFRSSPLQIAIKEEAPGQPKKFRVCCNLSFKGSMGCSINDEIDAKDFPTCWGTAEQVTNFVSIMSSLLHFRYLNVLRPRRYTLLRSFMFGSVQT